MSIAERRDIGSGVKYRVMTSGKRQDRGIKYFTRCSEFTGHDVTAFTLRLFTDSDRAKSNATQTIYLKQS